MKLLLTFLVSINGIHIAQLAEANSTNPVAGMATCTEFKKIVPPDEAGYKRCMDAEEAKTKGGDDAKKQSETFNRALQACSLSSGYKNSNHCNHKRFQDCSDDYDKCGKITEELLNKFNVRKVKKYNVDQTDGGSEIKTPRDNEVIEKELLGQNSRIEAAISEYKNKNMGGACRNLSPKQIYSHIASGLDDSKKNIEKFEEEEKKIEKELQELMSQKQEENSLTDKIQKNNAEIAKLASELPALLKTNELKVQQQVDQLKANFEIQDTKIKDIKNAIGQLDDELKDKIAAEETACAKEAKADTDKEKARLKAMKGRNNLGSISNTLGSAAAGGTEGVQVSIYNKFYNACIEEKGIRESKSKAHRDYLRKKQAAANELNRAIIEAARIQAAMDQLIKASIVENENLKQKITTRRNELQSEVQVLGARLQQLVALNAEKQKSLLARKAKNQIDLKLNQADFELFSKVKTTLGISPSKDVLETPEMKKFEEDAQAVRDVAGWENYFTSKSKEEKDGAPKVYSATFGGSYNCETQTIDGKEKRVK